jgi:hypothetical protein
MIEKPPYEPTPEEKQKAEDMAPKFEDKVGVYWDAYQDYYGREKMVNETIEAGINSGLTEEESLEVLRSCQKAGHGAGGHHDPESRAYSFTIRGHSIVASLDSESIYRIDGRMVSKENRIKLTDKYGVFFSKLSKLLFAEDYIRPLMDKTDHIASDETITDLLR